MASKTPPFPPHPSWSQAKFFGFLRSALRNASSRWPPKYEVAKAARRPYKGKDKRIKFEIQCAECKGWFKLKNTSVDHIIPAGKLSSFEDLPGFVERLFCGKEGLQILCSGCHQTKTNKEREDAKTAH